MNDRDRDEEIEGGRGSEGGQSGIYIWSDGDGSGEMKKRREWQRDVREETWTDAP